MNVSILITSFNRLHFFGKTWESIKPQLIEGDELVVVEDGWQQWDGFLGTLGIRYSYYATGNREYRSGVIAKNIGLKLARNPIIIINDPEVIQVTPCITTFRQMLSDNPRQFLVPYTLKSEPWSNPEPKDLKIIQNQMAPFVGGTMKNELVAVGGWDERFKYWGNDDNDLMYRLGLNGVQHKSVEGMEVYHQWHPRPPQKAMGDYNEPILYEEKKNIVANEGQDWGKIL